MTQEQRAALFHAQCSLRCTVKQLDRDLDQEIASPIISAIRMVIQVCDDAMRPPCERKPRWWKRLRKPSDGAARRQLAECRATLQAIVDQLAH